MAHESGFGAKLLVDTGSGLVEIPQISAIAFPTVENVMAEVSGHDSPGGYQQFAFSGMRNLPPFDVTISWDGADATHIFLETILGTGATTAFGSQSSDSNGINQTFNAIVAKIAPSSEPGDVLKKVVTIQPSGALTDV